MEDQQVIVMRAGTGLPSSVCVVDCAINGSFIGDQISLSIVFYRCFEAHKSSFSSLFFYSLRLKINRERKQGVQAETRPN